MMALLVICAAGFWLGLAFDLFALVVAIAAATPIAFLTSAQIGSLGGFFNAVSISASLQVGYVLGLGARQIFETGFAVRAARLFLRPGRR